MEDFALKIDSDPNNVFFRCVEDSSEAIMISDRKGVLAYVNPAWSKIYGYSREEAVGATPRLLHSGYQSESFYREMWSQIRNPSAGYWKGELINKAKDGALVPVLLTITPFRSNGEIVGYMGIAVDMSQKKEYEARIAHQDRLASIGMLASGLAHEVGTPLGVVRGRAEFLMMQEKDETARRGLEVIVAQIDRISKLIRSLLRVGRSFSDVHLQEVVLVDVIDEVISLVGQNLRAEHVEIRVEVPRGLRVWADFNRLEQVFLNLVMNSIHAIQTEIRAGRKDGHVLVISTHAQGNKIAVDVKDSGCGIPEKHMKNLFRPFFTTKDVGQGTGLGLAIVAQIVREMNGQINVQSTEGQGATFTILLPAIPHPQGDRAGGPG